MIADHALLHSITTIVLSPLPIIGHSTKMQFYVYNATFWIINSLSIFSEFFNLNILWCLKDKQPVQHSKISNQCSIICKVEKDIYEFLGSKCGAKAVKGVSKGIWAITIISDMQIMWQFLTVIMITKNSQSLCH